MQQSFYEESVSCYQQVLKSTAGILKKGADYAEQSGRLLSEIVDFRLHETMLPFSFQVISVCHHSLGAVRGMREGVFTPPPSRPGINYGGLSDLVDEAIEGLSTETQQSMEELTKQPMIFRLGETEIPFTTDNFLATFSKPNFYFHATTTYSILRTLGTPLGKRDFLGEMSIGH